MNTIEQMPTVGGEEPESVPSVGESLTTEEVGDLLKREVGRMRWRIQANGTSGVSDVYADTWLKVWQASKKDITVTPAYVRAALRHRVIDSYRKQRRRTEEGFLPAHSVDVDMLGQTSPTEMLVELRQQAEAGALLAAAIRTGVGAAKVLPERDRKKYADLIETLLEDPRRTDSEVARVLGVARQRISDWKRSLAKFLHGWVGTALDEANRLDGGQLGPWSEYAKHLPK